MSELLSIIKSQLRAGYDLKKVSASSSGSGMYHVVDSEGNTVKNTDNMPLGFIDNDSYTYRRQAIGFLRRAGVLLPQQKKTHTPKKKEAPPKPAPAIEKVVEDIMRDPRATPRERKVAREYMNVAQRLSEMAHKLTLANKRNDELSDLIRRYVDQRRQEQGERETINQLRPD